jgi:hypothetical protein
MYTKKFFRNLFLISLLVAGVVIVSAQVDRKDHKEPEKTADTTDQVPPPDNKEGLTELNKIIDRYKGANMVLTGEINYYENIDSSRSPSEKAQFTSVSTAWSSSYEIDSILTIIQDGKTLMIDKKEKSMSLIDQTPDENDKQAVSSKRDIGAELEQFLSFIYSARIETKGSEKMLAITFIEDAPFNINRYDVFYNPETYRVMRIKIEMLDGDIIDSAEDIKNEDDREELVFVDSANNEIPTGYYAEVRTNIYEVIYKSEKTVEPGYIDMDNYIRKDANGEYIPAGPFRHYELTN